MPIYAVCLLGVLWSILHGECRLMLAYVVFLLGQYPVTVGLIFTPVPKLYFG